MPDRTITAAALLLTMMVGVAAGQEARAPQAPELRDRNPVSSAATVLSTAPAIAQLPTGTNIHLQLQTELSTDFSKINEPFMARVAEPVLVDDNIVIPAGATVQGRVADVTNTQRRFRGKVSLRLLPQRLIMPDGRMFDFNAAMIDSDERSSMTVGGEGDISTRATPDVRMALIGAGVGAVVGGVIGAKAGALIGAGIGATLPAARWAARNNSVELPAGSQYWFETTTPLRASGSSAAPVTNIPPMHSEPGTE